MPTPRSFRDLSPQCRQLVRLIQQVRFGRIEALPILRGEPVLDRGLEVVQEVRFAGDDAMPKRANATDFNLSAQVVELVLALARIGDGQIASLTIKNGLPFGMQVTRRIAAA